MTIEAYQALRVRGFLLAGGLGDLSQRACVYHHMYEDSGGRNVFPLIAAHGALWASGYFKKGMLAGRVLSLRHSLNPDYRNELLNALYVFADKFRDINRRVCAESYAIYHYTKQYGRTEAIEAVVGADFLDILCKSHASRQAGTAFSQEDRAKLFSVFFNWEQDNIVAPSVIAAYEAFDWQLIKRLALRPKVEFAYFGSRHGLQFENFSSVQERITRGLQAYERAEAVGLNFVERALSFYKIMPSAFMANPGQYFKSIELAVA